MRSWWPRLRTRTPGAGEVVGVVDRHEDVQLVAKVVGEDSVTAAGAELHRDEGVQAKLYRLYGDGVPVEPAGHELSVVHDP